MLNIFHKIKEYFAPKKSWLGASQARADEALRAFDMENTK